MAQLTHENKLGMFIHWGPYSLTGFHEQALARLNMDHAEYEKLAMTFNPIAYDPEEWVLLAKEVGMKYICFTAKHHDGFCMWDTKETDYNIMNTPYGKDVLKMLADACEKHGMLLSVYYSNPDWHHPYGNNPASSHQWKAKYPDAVDTEKYRAFIKAQITELLTGYGSIYTLFWDIPPKVEDPSLNELVRKLQPNIYINDRGWSEGDFSTPERDNGRGGLLRFARMTEACNSVGRQSWGYRINEDFHSKRYLCCAIDKYMSLGGSYLLNVGPDANGVIGGRYRERLLRVAEWYHRMEGCLECSDEDTFKYGIVQQPCNVAKKDGKTYLHFYNGLDTEAVVMENYPCPPKSVRLMNTGKSLAFDLIYLPDFFRGKPEAVKTRQLHIYGIDVDALETEPIVIEIEWETNEE